MRRAFLLALLILPGACSLLSSSDQRYVVFFGDGSVTVDDSGNRVIATAANYIVAHPGETLSVAGFADPSGTPEANAQIVRSRVEGVAKELRARGVPSARIGMQEIGQVAFALNSQESRRVVMTVSKP